MVLKDPVNPGINYLSTYKVGSFSHYLQTFYIPGGILGYLPSTVSHLKGTID